VRNGRRAVGLWAGVEHVHELCFAAECTERKTTADVLTECGDVGLHAKHVHHAALAVARSHYFVGNAYCANVASGLKHGCKKLW
jgi:hypothetical protein